MKLKEMEGTIKINTHHDLGPVIRELAQNEVGTCRKVAEICADYGIQLNRLPEEYQFSEEKALGVINEGMFTESIILFKTFFLCFTFEPYQAKYRDLEQEKENKFTGQYQMIEFLKQEKKHLRSLIKEAEPVNITEQLSKDGERKDGEVESKAAKLNQETKNQLGEESLEAAEAGEVNFEEWESCPRCGSCKVNKIKNSLPWKKLIKGTFFLGIGGFMLPWFFNIAAIILLSIWGLAIIAGIARLFDNSTKLKCKDCDFKWKYPYEGQGVDNGGLK